MVFFFSFLNSLILLFFSKCHFLTVDWSAIIIIMRFFCIFSHSLLFVEQLSDIKSGRRRLKFESKPLSVLKPPVIEFKRTIKRTSFILNYPDTRIELFSLNGFLSINSIKLSFYQNFALKRFIFITFKP